MKNLLLVALVLFCTSCEEDRQTEVRYLGKENPKDEIPFKRVTHFEYKGHKYIQFEVDLGQNKQEWELYMILNVAVTIINGLERVTCEEQGLPAKQIAHFGVLGSEPNLSAICRCGV